MDELDKKYLKKVASTVKRRAYIFTCSYETAWDKYLRPDEKFGFSWKDVKRHLRWFAS